MGRGEPFPAKLEQAYHREMNVGPLPPAQRIVIAQLEGEAQRQAHVRADDAAAIAKLHAISADPSSLGLARGSLRATGYYAATVRLCELAGADVAVVREQTARMQARIGRIPREWRPMTQTGRDRPRGQLRVPPEHRKG